MLVGRVGVLKAGFTEHEACCRSFGLVYRCERGTEAGGGGRVIGLFLVCA